jgi:hypothetical protein
MNLPARESSRIYGWGVSRAIRVLWAERCSVPEICAALGVSRQRISQALRWKGHVCIAP